METDSFNDFIDRKQLRARSAEEIAQICWDSKHSFAHAIFVLATAKSLPLEQARRLLTLSAAWRASAPDLSKASDDAGRVLESFDEDISPGHIPLFYG